MQPTRSEPGCTAINHEELNYSHALVRHCSPRSLVGSRKKKERAAREIARLIPNIPWIRLRGSLWKIPNDESLTGRSDSCSSFALPGWNALDSRNGVENISELLVRIALARAIIVIDSRKRDRPAKPDNPEQRYTRRTLSRERESRITEK